MTEPKKLPVFLALKEKAVRFRDKLAEKLNEAPELVLTGEARQHLCRIS